MYIYQYIYIAGGREKAKLHTSTRDRDGPSFGLLILHLVALNNCEQNSTDPRLLGGSFCVATGTEKTLVKKFLSGVTSYKGVTTMIANH